jgi:4-hydroxy-4-methyl-2-oxoglutarate aldolase
MSEVNGKDNMCGTTLIEQLELLYSAVVADVLDSLGHRNQTLDSRVRALTPLRHVSGRVFTAKALRVTEIPAEPYKLEIGAVEAMTSGDVLVVDAEYTDDCGFWGELLTTACMYKGVRGVVMTACTRDMWKIKDIAFPIFGIGYHPADSKGRADIIKIGQPITISGVSIFTGDLILGDEDGVVVIPQAVAPETIRLAQEKVSGENIVRTELAKGMPMGEAFRKYGIL